MPRLRSSFPPSPLSWRQAWAATLDFVFPPRCASCGRDGAHLCQTCLADFTAATGPRCPRCWATGGAGLCDRCASDPPAFTSLRAAFVFRGALREAVHALKYQGVSAAAAPLIARVESAALPAGIDLVTAVPMAGRRRRRRGYNQAEVLARQLAQRAALRIDPRALRRTRRTAEQSRQPTVAARRANVRGAFAARAARVQGRRVLVVDDVTTSGATLEACAAALLDAGADEAHVWALARGD